MASRHTDDMGDQSPRARHTPRRETGPFEKRRRFIAICGDNSRAFVRDGLGRGARAARRRPRPPKLKPAQARPAPFLRATLARASVATRHQPADLADEIRARGGRWSIYGARFRPSMMKRK
jgi:hypothetical protein